MLNPEESAYEDTEVRHEIQVKDPDGLSKRFSKNPDTASDTYTMYPNTDLKYMKERGIDIQRLRKHNPHVPELHMESFDTIIYRLKECVRTGSITLDLSNLNLTKLPSYHNIPPTVKHLFLANNSLSHTLTLDLRQFQNLEVLDIDHNKFTKLPILPNKLVELSCSNNKLDNISSLTQYRCLERLEVSHNKLTDIPDLSNIRVLRCTNNQISQMGQTHKLQKLWIDNNKLTELKRLSNLIAITL